jgi:hypothetical protein
MASRFLLMSLAGTLFSSICVTTPAAADPLTVTSGQLVAAWDDPSYFIVSGEGFMVSGLFVPVQFSPQQLCFTGCAPGTSVDFSALFGSSSGSLGVATAATVDGVTYAVTPPIVNLVGALVVDAPTIVLPTVTAFDHATITAPFLFHGHVAAFDRSAPASALFALDLAGSGTVELTFTTSTMRYTQPEVAYVFSAASPVPEPASAVLLVTGLAALGGRKMLRLRTHSSR